MIYTLTGITKRSKYIYYHICCTFPDGRINYLKMRRGKNEKTKLYLHCVHRPECYANLSIFIKDPIKPKKCCMILGSQIKNTYENVWFDWWRSQADYCYNQFSWNQIWYHEDSLYSLRISSLGTITENHSECLNKLNNRIACLKLSNCDSCIRVLWPSSSLYLRTERI